MGGGMNNGMMMPPPTGNNNSMNMPMDDGMKMMMHMTFFWGHNVQILFSGWPGDRGVGVYILALFVVFIASALVECFAYLPHRLLFSSTDGKSISKGLILTVLAAVKTTLSYLVMLAVMSFNVGVLIVAVAGHALGFFVFGSNCLFKWAPTAAA